MFHRPLRRGDLPGITYRRNRLKIIRTATLRMMKITSQMSRKARKDARNFVELINSLVLTTRSPKDGLDRSIDQ